MDKAHICCVTCSRLLTGLSNTSDCYFCLTNTKGITSKSKHTLEYPNLPSAIIRRVPHSEDLPVPPQPVSMDINDNTSSEEDQNEDYTDLQDPSFEVAMNLIY